MKQEQRIMTIIFTILLTIILTMSFAKRMCQRYCESQMLEPVIDRQEYTPTPTLAPRGQVWSGKASYYSVDGCLGCTPYYDENGLFYIMANGQRLDDDKKTIAFNQLPLGTKVKVLNTENMWITDAVVADTGGFNAEPYNKVADLTKAVLRALNATGNVNVEIWEI